jgi:hypothetical protein
VIPPRRRRARRRLARTRRDRVGILVAAHDLCDPLGGASIAGDRGARHLEQRLERRRLRDRTTLTGAHGEPVAQATQLRDEPRLSDPRLPHHRDEVRPLSPARPVERPAQEVELGIAADHRQVETAVLSRASGSTPSSRHAATGSRLPFASIDATCSPRAACPTSAQVASPTSTSPGSAACSRRAATLTASPTTRDSPRVGSRASTSPVLTPIRAWISPISRTASRISRAARNARSASSSCTVGMPNTAMRASPITFSTVPPWRSTGARTAA